MNIVLWIIQVALMVLFAGSGLAKSTLSRERLIATGQTGIAVYPMPVVRFTAGCEIAGALGLVLPWATGIARGLTPLAALGLAAIMVGAASAHARLREPRSVAANLAILALALTVAVFRFADLA
jgi:DoxX-like family